MLIIIYIVQDLKATAEIIQIVPVTTGLEPEQYGPFTKKQDNGLKPF